jgi:hypothetical protein
MRHPAMVKVAISSHWKSPDSPTGTVGLTDSELESSASVLSWAPGTLAGSLLSDATEDKPANQSRDPGESH